MALSLLGVALVAGAQEQGSWLEAAVRKEAPAGWRIDVIDDSKVALTLEKHTNVVLSLYGDDSACPEGDNPISPWPAERAEIVHEGREHAYTTCTTTSQGVLKTHVVYKDDAPEAPVPSSVIAVVRAVLAGAPVDSTSDAGADAEAVIVDDESIPEVDAAVSNRQYDPNYDQFLRIHGAGTYTRFSGPEDNWHGVGGIAFSLLGVTSANIGLDASWQLGFDGRDSDADAERRIGWTYDVHLGVALAAVGQLGTLGIAAGVGSDAVSSPSYGAHPTVPPAAYLYASPFLHLRFHRCFTSDIQASGALRSNRSHGLRLQGGLGIGCGDIEADGTMRFFASGSWQEYASLDVTGLGVLAGIEMTMP